MGWRIATGCKINSNGNFVLFSLSLSLSLKILKALEERNERLHCPSICPPSIYSLLLLCWSLNSKDRPKFQRIVQLLNQYRPNQYRVIRDNKQINQLTLVRGDTVSVFDALQINLCGKDKIIERNKSVCFQEFAWKRRQRKRMIELVGLSKAVLFIRDIDTELDRDLRGEKSIKSMSMIHQT